MLVIMLVIIMLTLTRTWWRQVLIPVKAIAEVGREPAEVVGWFPLGDPVPDAEALRRESRGKPSDDVLSLRCRLALRVPETGGLMSKEAEEKNRAFETMLEEHLKTQNGWVGGPRV
jgi:hypothetical protein